MRTKTKYISIILSIINLILFLTIYFIYYFNQSPKEALDKIINSLTKNEPKDKNHQKFLLEKETTIDLSLLNNQNSLYTPMGDRMKTKWSKNLDPQKVWSEYPRPQLERKEWTNLNGLWKYTIMDKKSLQPKNFLGYILVPFPIESSLSGVMKNFTENDVLWYEKDIQIINEWKNNQNKNNHLILHFDAVDYFCEVFINYIKIGEHKGGYTPFSFDIEKYIDFSVNYFKITVKVIDPTDKEDSNPLGKQKINGEEIYHSPVSGIWQTVWIEYLNDTYVKNLNVDSDFDNKQIIFIAEENEDSKQYRSKIEIKVFFNGTVVYQGNGYTNKYININLSDENFHPWSPDEPNLYNIEIILKDKNNETVDYVKSYSAIRKISKERDSKGILRFKLNNKFIFPMGALDQGYFPDGLYTPPSDDAQISDIQKLKQMGFNTIRKHLKVENSRYYYHCDLLGMMIFQDMPNVFDKDSVLDKYSIDGGEDMKKTQEQKKQFYKEWESIINFGNFFKSIVLWIPFNEGWGQFETKKIVNFTKEKDPTRLINAASGGNHRITGDVLDLHSYPQPEYFLKYGGLINIIGEYGGLGFFLERGHNWSNKNFGYKMLNKTNEVENVYIEYSKRLEKLVIEGISGAIYSQATDVEDEVDGLISYDREVVKVNVDKIKKANQEVINIINSLNKEE